MDQVDETPPGCDEIDSTIRTSSVIFNYDETTSPLIGLEFIIEVESDSEFQTVNTFYKCLLCEIMCKTVEKVQQHAAHPSHRLLYLNKYFPRASDLIATAGPLDTWKPETFEHLNAMIRRIESVMGRMQMPSVKRSQWDVKGPVIRQKIEESADHFKETPSLMYHDVVPSLFASMDNPEPIIDPYPPNLPDIAVPSSDDETPIEITLSDSDSLSICDESLEIPPESTPASPSEQLVELSEISSSGDIEDDIVFVDEISKNSDPERGRETPGPLRNRTPSPGCSRPFSRSRSNYRSEMSRQKRNRSPSECPQRSRETSSGYRSDDQREKTKSSGKSPRKTRIRTPSGSPQRPRTISSGYKSDENRGKKDLSRKSPRKRRIRTPSGSPDRSRTKSMDFSRNPPRKRRTRTPSRSPESSKGNFELKSKYWRPLSPKPSHPPTENRSGDSKNDKRSCRRAYERELEVLKDSLMRRQKIFMDQPEDHPQYAEEWEKFYRRRSCDKNKILSKDLTDNWFDYWDDRLEQLGKKEMKKSVKELKKRYAKIKKQSLDPTPPPLPPDPVQDLTENGDILRRAIDLKDDLGCLAPSLIFLLSKIVLPGQSGRVLKEDPSSYTVLDATKAKLDGLLTIKSLEGSKMAAAQQIVHLIDALLTSFPPPPPPPPPPTNSSIEIPEGIVPLPAHPQSTDDEKRLERDRLIRQHRQMPALQPPLPPEETIHLHPPPDDSGQSYCFDSLDPRQNRHFCPPSYEFDLNRLSVIIIPTSPKF